MVIHAVFLWGDQSAIRPRNSQVKFVCYAVSPDAKRQEKPLHPDQLLADFGRGVGGEEGGWKWELDVYKFPLFRVDYYSSIAEASAQDITDTAMNNIEFWLQYNRWFHSTSAYVCVIQVFAKWAVDPQFPYSKMRLKPNSDWLPVITNKSRDTHLQFWIFYDTISVIKKSTWQIVT